MSTHLDMGNCYDNGYCVIFSVANYILAVHWKQFFRIFEKFWSIPLRIFRKSWIIISSGSRISDSMDITISTALLVVINDWVVSFTVSVCFICILDLYNLYLLNMCIFVICIFVCKLFTLYVCVTQRFEVLQRKALYKYVLLLFSQRGLLSLQFICEVGRECYNSIIYTFL